jgi:RNA polymerase sigma factor (sigma-70 family)
MMMNEKSDSELIQLYIHGNESALEGLVKKHKSRIFTAIYLIVKDRYVAEDLLQETFIKVINKLKSGEYNEEGKFLPWILRIAHNMAIDQFRRNKRHPTIVLEDGSNVFNSLCFSEDSAESIQLKEDSDVAVRGLIDALPEHQKQVVIMRHYNDMSFQEIADATGVSINTALGRMRYALINLRKKLQNSNIAYDKSIYPE